MAYELTVHAVLFPIDQYLTAEGLLQVNKSRLVITASEKHPIDNEKHLPLSNVTADQAVLAKAIEPGPLDGLSFKIIQEEPLPLATAAQKHWFLVIWSAASDKQKSKQQKQRASTSFDEAFVRHMQLCGLHARSSSPVYPPAVTTRCSALEVKASKTTQETVSPFSHLPPSKPVEARTTHAFPSKWPRLRFYMHHRIRGDMFTFGAMLLLFPRTHIDLIYAPKQQAKIAKHSNFLHSILNDPSLPDALTSHPRSSRAIFQLLEREVPEAIAKEAEKKAKEAKQKEVDPALFFYDWLKTLKKSRSESQVLSVQAKLWEPWNNPGLATGMVGRAFQEQPELSRAIVRRGFVDTLPPKVSKAAGEYAKKAFPDGGIYVVIWIRNGKDGEEWNMNTKALGQLIELVVQESAQCPVHLQITGDQPPKGAEIPSDLPGGKSLIKFWEQPDFPHANDRRCQLAFWDHVAHRSDCRVIHIGSRSGALEPLVLLGMTAIYLEPKREEEVGKTRTDRMLQWHGRLAYYRVQTDVYLGPRKDKEGKELTKADMVKIHAQLHTHVLEACRGLGMVASMKQLQTEKVEPIGKGKSSYAPLGSGSLYDAFLRAVGGPIQSTAKGKVKTDLVSDETQLRLDLGQFETDFYTGTTLKPQRHLQETHLGDLDDDLLTLACRMSTPIEILYADGSTKRVEIPGRTRGRPIRLFRKKEPPGFYPVVAVKSKDVASSE